MNLRSGLAGFVGGLKHSIKGFFSYQYSKTSESVVISTEPSIIVNIVMSSESRGISISYIDRYIVVPHETRVTKL